MLNLSCLSYPGKASEAEEGGDADGNEVRVLVLLTGHLLLLPGHQPAKQWWGSGSGSAGSACPGSGSISQRCWSGSGSGSFSFLINVLSGLKKCLRKKNFNTKFYIFKTEDDVPVGNLREKIRKEKNYFFNILIVVEERSWIRIRIRTKMSRIPNTAA